jgi:hypothetical protein
LRTSDAVHARLFAFLAITPPSSNYTPDNKWMCGGDVNWLTALRVDALLDEGSRTPSLIGAVRGLPTEHLLIR